ncbi:MAG: hypothetical protein E7K27_22560, partial [[Clostridium] symbiosum]|nr:hypothetical protein [[Clostridium] symbiosum]
APPAKQVVSCFRHYHFSEHEKLQCLQLAKARMTACTLRAQVTAFNAKGSRTGTGSAPRPA